MADKDRLIFHVDVNSAFLSWEAVDRLSRGEELDLREVPSCVGGDPGSRTAIVTTKSIPAKKYGIVTGEPISAAFRKCPQLIVVPVNFPLYKRMSMAFKEILREYSPVTESFSIDEMFLDMSGMHLLYPDPVATAHEIKDRIRDTLGFTVNVGIGPNKLLAKMASDLQKPDRVHTLFFEEIEGKMWPLSVRDLFGCGKATAEKLEGMQILTIGDLAMTDISLLRAKFGDRMAQYLHESAGGHNDDAVVAEAEDAKSYGVETTTEENLTDLAAINHLLLAQADVVGARLRADSVKAFTVTVIWRTTDFKRRSHGRKRKTSTDITEEIYADAVSLMKEAWGGEPLRLIGITASDVDHDGFEQMSLFGSEDREKQKKLDQALDSIRERYGNDSVLRAGVGVFRPNRRD